MRTHFLFVALFALVFVVGTPAPEVEAKDKAPNFAQVALKGAVLGEGFLTDQLLLFPIQQFSMDAGAGMGESADNDIVLAASSANLKFSEPELPSRRYNVLATNTGAKPILVMGGTVLVGGNRDRLVRRDTIVPANGETEIECLPAASTSDKRKEAEPFRIANMLAPPYLRKKADFGASLNLVPTFVSKFLEFRNEKDQRKSLAAIGESDTLEAYCLACHKSLADFPKSSVGGKVIGVIGAVRGRLQLLVLFPDNEKLQESFESLLKGFTYAAAAIELRAKRAGIPIPGRDDPEETKRVATEAAKKLLASLQKARFKSEKSANGETFAFRTSNGVRGRATGLNGKLQHLVAFPHDPFESALYRTTLDVPEQGSGDSSNEGPETSFTRKGAARLSEAERRLLRRLRGGRRGGVGGVNPRVRR